MEQQSQLAVGPVLTDVVSLLHILSAFLQAVKSLLILLCDGYCFPASGISCQMKLLQPYSSFFIGSSFKSGLLDYTASVVSRQLWFSVDPTEKRRWIYNVGYFNHHIRPSAAALTSFFFEGLQS